MWRITRLLKKTDGLTAADAFNGLLNEHAPRLMAAPMLIGRHLKKIDFAIGCNAPASGLPSSFDLNQEFWFDDEQAAGRALALLTQDADLLASEGRYAHAAGTVTWMGEYRPNLQLPGVKLKLTATGDIADGISEAEALRYWADMHPRVARTAEQFWSYLRLYAQIHGRHVPGLTLYRPMAAEVGFEGIEDFVAAFSHAQYASIVRPDENKFSKPGDMYAFATMDQRAVFQRK
jgi:EthD domain